MSKSIIIIGGGIAGLCAGCYGRMNGYPTRIFELHNLPGGLCTSWKRKGYTFDLCIHWLVGSGPGNALYDVWRELGALQGRSFVDHEVFNQIEKDGKIFKLYTNVDKLVEHMKSLSPADAALIDELGAAIRRFTKVDMPIGKPAELRTLVEKVRTMAGYLPFMYPLWKWGKLSIQEYSTRFKDPFLRWAFLTSFDLPDFPMVAFIMTMAWMHNRSSGYPIGGSLEFARAIERRFLDLGGEIGYNARVQKIIVENDRAVGVRLADGTEHRADHVISAADGHATIFDMLEGKYVDDKIRERYATLPAFDSIIQVSLGVDMDLSHEPNSILMKLDQPIKVADQEVDVMHVMNYSFDPTLAPKGKSVVVTRIMSKIDYWRDLASDRERYEAEKKKIADIAIREIDRRFPDIVEAVEAVDVSTPLTMERYTGNWNGSMEGWLITTKSIFMSMKKTLPGLRNFHMIGQWLQPGGGLPPAAMHGREVVQLLCHEDGIPFTTSIP